MAGKLTKEHWAARYDAYQRVTAQCRGCGKTRAEGTHIFLHYSNGHKCVAMTPWRFKVPTLEACSGYCKGCAPVPDELPPQKPATEETKAWDPLWLEHWVEELCNRVASTQGKEPLTVSIEDVGKMLKTRYLERLAAAGLKHVQPK